MRWKLGIFLFLTVFLLVLLFFLIRGKEEGQEVEIRGVDGARLKLTPRGVFFVKEGKMAFLSKDSITGFSVEREGELYTVKVRGDSQEFELKAPKGEVEKLFKRSSAGSPEPMFPYLLPFTGALLTGLLLGELAHGLQGQESGEETQRDFELKEAPEDEFDYFDTGDGIDGTDEL